MSAGTFDLNNILSTSGEWLESDTTRKMVREKFSASLSPLQRQELTKVIDDEKAQLSNLLDQFSETVSDETIDMDTST